MSIDQNSRYFLAQQRKIDTSKGAQMVIYTPPVKFTNTTYIEILTTAGQTMDSIAATVFSDSRQWWRIADANPQVAFPFDLAPGTVLRVPV